MVDSRALRLDASCDKHRKSGLIAENLQVGSVVTVPLPFDIVPTNIRFTSALTAYCVRGIAARYPVVKIGEVGKSVMGRTLWYLSARPWRQAGVL
ncbi:MAG: hypothetical protein ACLUZX_12210 [Subdoligranulum sp.]